MGSMFLRKFGSPWCVYVPVLQMFENFDYSCRFRWSGGPLLTEPNLGRLVLVMAQPIVDIPRGRGSPTFWNDSSFCRKLVDLTILGAAQIPIYATLKKYIRTRYQTVKPASPGRSLPWCALFESNSACAFKQFLHFELSNLTTQIRCFVTHISSLPSLWTFS